MNSVGADILAGRATVQPVQVLQVSSAKVLLEDTVGFRRVSYGLIGPASL